MKRRTILSAAAAAAIAATVAIGGGLIGPSANAGPPVKTATLLTTTVSAHVTADSIGVASATLTCPTGYVATGGFWDLDSLNGSVTTNRLLPDTNNQWEILATQLDPGQPVDLSAMCVSLSTS